MDGFNTCKKTLKTGKKLIRLEEKIVMGVLNLTPDSFYPGSRITTERELLEKAELMIMDGAAILDVGGYSTRPGAEEVDQESELKRVIDPVRKIKREFPEIILSIDTFRPEVAERSLDAGADMINDIYAGEPDQKMFEIALKYQVPYIIMHMKGTPKDMNSKTQYDDLLREIIQFFELKISKLKHIGVNDVIIDPGFGFAKTVRQNFELLKNLNLLSIFNLPIVVGISRKSMIYRTLNSTPDEALNGTTVINTIALLNGADILRVHDVREAVEAIKLLRAYKAD
jgi:dihydropteroate synthase